MTNEGNQNKANEQSENAIEAPVKDDPSPPKRKRNDSDNATAKKSKAEVDDDDETEVADGDNNQAVPSNPRFEWYDEIKLALGKAPDQTLSLDVLKKKVTAHETTIGRSTFFFFRF